jgi:hypothetical protein
MYNVSEVGDSGCEQDVDHVMTLKPMHVHPLRVLHSEIRCHFMRSLPAIRNRPAGRFPQPLSLMFTTSANVAAKCQPLVSSGPSDCGDVVVHYTEHRKHTDVDCLVMHSAATECLVYRVFMRSSTFGTL